MSCPTCDHTMHALAGGDYFWCPRCGTLKRRVIPALGQEDVSIPKLVERCRQFEETLGPRWGEIWHVLGVNESIHRPEDRGTP